MMMRSDFIGYFLSEESPTAPMTNILLRGSATRPGAKVGPGVPTVLAAKQAADLDGWRVAVSRYERL